VITAFLGFPLAVVLAWAYEITPTGVIRDLGDEVAEQDRRAALTPASSETTAVDGTTLSQYQGVRVSWRADGRQRVADFRRPFIIGRDSDVDVQLMHNKISRRHARVHFEAGQWWIADLNSRNGTYLDGTRLSEPAPLGARSEVALFKDGPPIVISACHEGMETVLDG
jgi:pSer/pThr/pTyr-binding forkhead associated (FHA) protein